MVMSEVIQGGLPVAAGSLTALHMPHVLDRQVVLGINDSQQSW